MLFDKGQSIRIYDWTPFPLNRTIRPDSAYRHTKKTRKDPLTVFRGGQYSIHATPFVKIGNKNFSTLRHMGTDMLHFLSKPFSK